MENQFIHKIKSIFLVLAIFYAILFFNVFVFFLFIGPKPGILIGLSSLISILVTYKIVKLNVSKIELLNLSSTTVIIIGLSVWSLIIGIPQFIMNYSIDLLNGKSNIGDIPSKFYLGLISGAFASFLILGLIGIIENVYFSIAKKAIDRNLLFLQITFLIFLFMIIKYSTSMYATIITTEERLFELREIIINHNLKS